MMKIISTLIFLISNIAAFELNDCETVILNALEIIK